jgi:homoserine O-succinyltransferase
LPIALPTGLPARAILAAEGIDLLAGDDLRRRGERPLRICLVNLMPNKIATETQLCRLLGGTPIPVAVTLCVPDSYRSKTGPAGHLDRFYRPWSRIRDETFDGLIVTGAPIETLPFEEVTYWSELCAIFDWAKARIASSYYICWAAQAALYHFHAVPKHPLPAKAFGVFHQRVAAAESGLLAGLGDEFPVAVSRHTEVRAADLPDRAGVTLLAASAEAGLCLVEDRANRTVCMFNHVEYDAWTLAEEYMRDRRAGQPIAIPRNYFPDDDPERAPANIWRPYGHRLFANWLAEIARTAGTRATGEPFESNAGGGSALRTTRCAIDYAALPTSFG